MLFYLFTTSSSVVLWPTLCSSSLDTTWCEASSQTNIQRQKIRTANLHSTEIMNFANAYIKQSVFSVSSEFPNRNGCSAVRQSNRNTDGIHFEIKNYIFVALTHQINFFFYSFQICWSEFWWCRYSHQSISAHVLTISQFQMMVIW